MESIPQDKLSLIQAWQESGLCKQQFCNQQKIGYHFFNYWEKKFRILSGLTQPTAAKKTSGFIQVDMPMEKTPAAEIIFPGGIKVILHQADASFIKSLIA